MDKRNVIIIPYTRAEAAQPQSQSKRSGASLRGWRRRAKRGEIAPAMKWSVLQAVCLLLASNVFMTFAWYAHLKDMRIKPWLIAALLSWGIAFFEYMLQVPANRIGSETLSLPQLKIIQEVITLTVFVPFLIFYMKQPLKWDYVWAGMCMCGAVYFVFRK